MNPEQECSQLLLELGFTNLQADVYVYLLQHSPATGYKIANSLGRSYAITYRALKSLQAKGAILIGTGKKRLTRAVPLREFLDVTESRLKEKRNRLLETARKLRSSRDDPRIYHINSIDQLYGRCKTMLAAARERVLMELFPDPLRVLRKAVAATCRRAVDVTVRVYQPAEIPGARVVLSPFGDENQAVYKAQVVTLFVDGLQFLLGQLENKNQDVQFAVWSENLILARTMYSYINSDLHHYAFRDTLIQSESLQDVKRSYLELERAFPPGGDLGFKELLNRFSSEQ